MTPDGDSAPSGSRLRRAASATLRFARTLVDRAFHPGRRARARRRLRARGPVREILVVCYGNICRSPYAAARFRGRLGGEEASAVDVRSAGFFGPDRPSPPEAVEEAGRRGVDLASHRSRTLGVEDIVRADVVFVMDDGQRRRLDVGLLRAVEAEDVRPLVLVLGDLDPLPPPSRRGILDPFGADADTFRAVYERIDRCVTAAVDLLEEDPR